MKHVLHKLSSLEIVEIRHYGYGFVITFEEFATVRDVLHTLSSSEIIGGICSRHNSPMTFERVARMRVVYKLSSSESSGSDASVWLLPLALENFSK